MNVKKKKDKLSMVDYSRYFVDLFLHATSYIQVSLYTLGLTMGTTQLNDKYFVFSHTVHLQQDLHTVHTRGVTTTDATRNLTRNTKQDCD